MGCSSLTSVDIPDCVISIGEFTFKGCSSLTSVTIGDGVTSIGYYAFEDCSSLTSVTIGKGVTSINAGAFSDCSSLMDFYCYAVTSPALYNSPFSKYGEKVTLHVPAQCGTKYKSSDWGVYFKTIKEMD